MISPTYRKILYGLALIGIIIIMIMPDVVIGLLFELVHFFFELLFHIADISFEWIESTLDTLVEQLFHTELHQTQVIVFYLLIGMVLYIAYRLWRMLLNLFYRLNNTMQTVWARQKNSASMYWQELSLINKIKLLAVFAGIIYLASLLFF